MTETMPVADGARCPFPHGGDDRRTAAVAGHGSGPAIDKKSDGTWLIRSFSLARQILKSTKTRQAGFSAELWDYLPKSIKRPVIFLEGSVHTTMRKATVRYFTPKAVAENYHAPMSALSDRLVAELKAKGSADMDLLGLKLAMTMTAQIVGLTESSISGMARRLGAMTHPVSVSKSNPLFGLVTLLKGRWNSIMFWLCDVRPAVRARQKKPREDVISHLISLGYTDSEILSEAATYGPAGMATTREFMSVALWHLLDRREIKERFLVSSDEEKRSILEEILRLEPVVSHIERRALEDIELDHDGGTVVVPKGTFIRIDTRGANHDESAAGACPFSLDPDRNTTTKMTRALLTFGDGIHRCPGSYVALQESAIFLSKLLSVPNLRIAKAPTLTYNPQVGYEVRHFKVTTEPT